MNQAIAYVTKVKNRFTQDPQVYRDFLNILHNYQAQQTSVRDVYAQIELLFKEHADLRDEFAEFLPDNAR